MASTASLGDRAVVNSQYSGKRVKQAQRKSRMYAAVRTTLSVLSPTSSRLHIGAQELELQQRDGGNNDKEQQGLGTGKAEVEIPEGGVVDQLDQGGGGIARPASGHDMNPAEHLEGTNSVHHQNV